jgi:hypothetical protein
VYLEGGFVLGYHFILFYSHMDNHCQGTANWLKKLLCARKGTTYVIKARVHEIWPGSDGQASQKTRAQTYMVAEVKVTGRGRASAHQLAGSSSAVQIQICGRGRQFSESPSLVAVLAVLITAVLPVLAVLSPFLSLSGCSLPFLSLSLDKLEVTGAKSSAS